MFFVYLIPFNQHSTMLLWLLVTHLFLLLWSMIFYKYKTICSYYWWSLGLFKHLSCCKWNSYEYPCTGLWEVIVFFLINASVQFSSVQLLIVSNSLWPHGLQHSRLPCPSPTPRVYPNSCPLSQWYHPTISSSVIPFSFHPSFPALGSFQMSQLFASGGQSVGVSASTSVFPMNTQDWLL